MSKYIEADKLLSEINVRIERCEKDEEDGYPDTTSPKAILKSVCTIIDSLQQEQPEVELFEHPETPIKDAIEVTSRMKYIDEELKPIAEFIMSYASWNLHKNEWNQPTIEVPLFRVLDALAHRGKPYCGCVNARKED